MTSGHFEAGSPVMVDVGSKEETNRTAVAESLISLPVAALEQLRAAAAEPGHGSGGAGLPSTKGDAVAVAELAGIMAAKRTAELIPLCHTLPLSHVAVRGELLDSSVRFTATCSTRSRTGVEMEALVAASIASLTLYDMLKSSGHDMEITATRLLAKAGGRSGSWRRS